jgi:FkbM family methyltransferase
MNLRGGVKQLLRNCGHAFVSTVHDRLNDVDRQLGQITSQLGDVKAAVRHLKGAVAGASEDFAAHETRVFTRLARAGFAPATIFDIGAAKGAWSASISNVFPDATFHLFEPLAKLNEGYENSLQLEMRGHPKFALHEVALGAECKSVTMYVHADGYSSTTLDVGGHPEYQTRQSVPQHTLDQYVSDHALPLPDLIKLDTQGAEASILSRAERCLKQAELVFAETWFDRGYGPQTPLITELRDLLDRHNFELAELGYRFYDGNHRLYGCDAFFLKRSLLEKVALAMPSGPW